MLTTQTSVHALIEPGFSPDEIRQLKQGKIFRSQNVGQLVTQLLPKLKKIMPVAIQTNRLPQLSSMPPRLQIHTTQNRRVYSPWRPSFMATRFAPDSTATHSPISVEHCPFEIRTRNKNSSNAWVENYRSNPVFASDSRAPRPLSFTNDSMPLAQPSWATAMKSSSAPPCLNRVPRPSMVAQPSESHFAREGRKKTVRVFLHPSQPNPWSRHGNGASQ